MQIQRNEYRLDEYGITEPIHVFGSVTKLLPALGFPVVFLIDETHAEDCIAQNLENAKELVQRCNVLLVGVESHAGGMFWDDRFSQYTSRMENAENIEPIGDYPQFANGMRLFGANVLGVESSGLSNELFCDLTDKPPPPPIKDRPLNIARSKHFIRTLFQLRSERGLNGNLILNVGGNHNTHIAGWIQDGTIESKAGERAGYVRLRPPAYQESS